MRDDNGVRAATRKRLLHEIDEMIVGSSCPTCNCAWGGAEESYYFRSTLVSAKAALKAAWKSEDERWKAERKRRRQDKGGGKWR